ncbi:hypothetical protein [Lacinutrix sp. Bg11-31]|uniref:hypothetical protein n=1 Tax=Lacinutrix sp. Bg11-31 TaxID=2057808 RepID=UPI000C30D1C6|nr:hypothetical protein [Lacinutrix sp. Bg11-31]AUC82902.1 hypothetical protein CW733_12530 [Lacinutrix sp. Bg11-31]
MKNTTLLIVLLISSLSFGQTSPEKKAFKNPKYSENSEIVISYRDSIKQKQKSKPVAYYINDDFTDDQYLLNSISPKKIESFNIEKGNFTINNKQYYGKVLIKMNSNYKHSQISLKALSKKFLNLDDSPVLYQINDNIINTNYNTYLIDEDYILKILVSKVKTSNNIEINHIKLITKTKENIAEANTIKIRGNEIISPRD